MQSRLFTSHVDGNPQFIFETLKQRTPPVAIQQPHSADVSREVALTDEVGQHCLKKSGRADVGGEPNHEKSLNQIRWNNDVAEAQRWKQDFAERADVDHSRTTIETLQRGNGQALIAIFAIIVIFDDPRS